jgi:hypothetical protein
LYKSSAAPFSFPQQKANKPERQQMSDEVKTDQPQSSDSYDPYAYAAALKRLIAVEPILTRLAEAEKQKGTTNE